MRRVVLMLAVLTVLALVVTLTGCSGGNGAPDGATVDTAKKPPPSPPPEPTPCKLVASIRIGGGPHSQGTYDLCTMNTDGSDMQMLNIASALPGGPGWSPNAQQIVFSAFVSGTELRLHTVNADATGEAQFTTGAETGVPGGYCDCDADWAAGGIAFCRYVHAYDYPEQPLERIICVKQWPSGPTVALT